MSEPDFLTLCRTHTSLTAMQVAALRHILALLPFLADLAHARARLYLITRDGNHFLLAAQNWPHTVYLPQDGSITGALVQVSEASLLARAARERQIVTGQREGTSGNLLAMRVLPLLVGTELLGLVALATTEEVTQMEGYDRLFTVVRLLLQNPRKERDVRQFAPLAASDGLVVTDGGNRVTFATAAALHIFRVLGVGSLVGRHLFDRQLLQPIERETQVTSRPWEREIEAGGLILRLRDLPLQEGGELLARIVIVADLTGVREKEREIAVQSAVIQEIHHRVKNNLQTIASLLRMQARRAKSADVKAALGESVDRILSIAIVHEFLSADVSANQARKGADERVTRRMRKRPTNQAASGADKSLTLTANQGHATVNVRELAEKIFALVASNMVAQDFALKVACTGAELILPSSYASSLGLVLNELVLNAIQHGFQGRAAGQIALDLHETPDGYTLVFSDNGSGLPQNFDPQGRTLGISIMRTLIEGDLGGKIRYANLPTGGTYVSIWLPHPSLPLQGEVSP